MPHGEEIISGRHSLAASNNVVDIFSFGFAQLTLVACHCFTPVMLQVLSWDLLFLDCKFPVTLSSLRVCLSITLSSCSDQFRRPNLGVRTGIAKVLRAICLL